MAYSEYPSFVVQGHGECEYCGSKDVDLYCIQDYMWLCQDCLENEVTLCEECGELWISDAVEFYEAKDGRLVCEYCADNLGLTSEDEDEEEG